MPKFAVILTYDAAQTERRQEVRPSHREYLRSLADEGKLLHAGPFTDDSGALIVYEAESRADAEGFLANDPFTKNGIVKAWQMNEWNRVLP